MNYLSFIYKGSPRELKKIILIILKSWKADNIKRINYTQDYSLDKKKINKIEEKILLIHTRNEDNLLDFLSKNFPQIKKININ